MSITTLLKNKILTGLEKRAAIRVYDHIKLVDPTALRAAGISIELLSQGPAAFPWRTNPNEKVSGQIDMPSAIKASESEIRTGISELQSFSDAELHDLGISRGDIAHVVRFGRSGIDDVAANDQRQSAA